MVEFDETFSIRYSGKDALKKRVFYRLTPRRKEFPYFDGGHEFKEFSIDKNLRNLRTLLPEFDVSTEISGERIVVNNVIIEIPNLGETL